MWLFVFLGGFYEKTGSTEFGYYRDGKYLVKKQVYKVSFFKDYVVKVTKVTT